MSSIQEYNDNPLTDAEIVEIEAKFRTKKDLHV